MGYFARDKTVTDGKVFEIDAANKLCQGSDVRNVLSPSEQGTFIGDANLANDVYNFDGAGDYIDFGTTSAFHTLGTVGSIEFWLKRNLATTGGGVLGNITPSGSDTGIEIILRGDFNGMLVYRGQGAYYVQPDVDITPVTETTDWVHYTFTFNATEALIYVNSVQYSMSDNGSLWYTKSLNSPETFKIGKVVRYIPSVSINGEISNVNAHNKVLTQAEVTQNYNATKHRFQ